VGSAMTQAINQWPLTKDDRVQFQPNSYWTLVDILAMGEFFPRQFHPTNATLLIFHSTTIDNTILATDSVFEYTISLFLYFPFRAFFYLLSFLH
jgi:hypothetical protein